MRRWLLILLVLAASRPAYSQDDDIPHNLACWAGYELYLPFKEGGKWGLLLESYIKGNKFLAQLQGSFYRAGLNYYLKNGDRLGAGLAYQWNLPYDDAALPYAWPDYRIYEQYILRSVSQSGNTVWSHRFRAEQRWFGRKDSIADPHFDSYEIEQTFRYQARYQYWFKPRWALVIYDELHLRVPPSDVDKEKLIDQNRLYAGFAYSLETRRELRLEVGYMNQSFWKSLDTQEGRSRINHTIRITLTADYPMRHN